MAPSRPHLFILGNDYHLGDLLWLTCVLDQYRAATGGKPIVVSCPDRPISRILHGNPSADEVLYGPAKHHRAILRQRFGVAPVVWDLRILPLAAAMILQWRRRLPWLYYRDLWFRERGQWLATFLGLGRLDRFRPILSLSEEDRDAARQARRPYVLLAPHIGQYRMPLTGRLWRRLKGWPPERWVGLARRLKDAGFEPLTVGTQEQPIVPGTRGMMGLPIRQVAGLIEGAAALVTVESGLWFIAAAVRTPFVIVRWWLPRSVDWAAPMRVPYHLIYRDQDSVDHVFRQVQSLIRT